MISFTSVCGHTCYSTPLHFRPPFVVDLGANRGEFSFQILQLFGGNGILIEANPHLISDLADRFPTRKVINAAVSRTEGTLNFNISSNDEASSILQLPESEVYKIRHSETIEIPSITLTSLLQSFDTPIDLLKIDIEGAECQVLTPPPEALLQRVGQICIEFHCAPVFGYDLEKQSKDAIDSLTEMGFRAIDWSKGELTDVLFVNTRIHRLFSQKYALYKLREQASKLKRQLFYRRPHP
jgi:FkbM family methyltransferase